MFFENELEVLRALQNTSFGQFGHGINLLERLSAGEATGYVTEEGLQGLLDFLPLFSQLGERMSRPDKYQIKPKGLSGTIRSRLEQILRDVDQEIQDFQWKEIHNAGIAFWAKHNLHSVPPLPEIHPGLLNFLMHGHPEKGMGWKVFYIPESFLIDPRLLREFDQPREDDKINADGIHYGNKNQTSMRDEPVTLHLRKSFLRNKSVPGWYAVETERANEFEHNDDQVARWTGLKRRTGDRGLTLSEIKQVGVELAKFLQIPSKAVVLPSAEELSVFVPWDDLSSPFYPELCCNMAEEISGQTVDGVVLGSEFGFLSKVSDRPFSLRHAEVSRRGRWVSRFMIRLNDCTRLPFQKPERKKLY